MGITSSDILLLKRALGLKKIKTVLELGSQNLYLTPTASPPFADVWYKSQGIGYHCVDLAGDNNAMPFNWCEPIDWEFKYDLVTDFGSSEHSAAVHKYVKAEFHNDYIHSVYPVEHPTEEEIKDGYYQCWRNKFDALKIGGLMVNVNPLTGNWPGHGFSYIDSTFYHMLSLISDLKIVHIKLNAAMGNITDGWNVECILEKTGDRFPSKEEFNTLKIYRS